MELTKNWHIQRLLALAILLFGGQIGLAHAHDVRINGRPNEIASKVIEDGANSLSLNSGSLYYRFTGNRDALGLIFVHGTPGDWAAFNRYLSNQELQRRFFMVSLDRPGWGNSTLAATKLDGDFEIQSQAVGAIFAQYPDKKWIIIGHSLGASIAPKIALDYPDQTAGMLLLAGSLSPALGAPRWYNRAANTWLISRLVSKPMRNSNREIMGLKKQLSKLNESLLQNSSNAHVIVLQGMKDRLVSPKNAAFAEQEWQNAFASLEVIALDKAGHFLPWRHETTVLELIQKLADKIQDTRLTQRTEI